MASDEIVLKPISPEVTYELRRLLLHPGRSRAHDHQALDFEPGAWHLGAFVVKPSGDETGPMAIGSVGPDSFPGQETGGEAKDFRLRGIATLPNYRCRGIGSLLVKALLDYAAPLCLGGGRIWCYARPSARMFYERLGFVQKGEAVSLPGKGERLLLRHELKPGLIPETEGGANCKSS